MPDDLTREQPEAPAPQPVRPSRRSIEDLTLGQLARRALFSPLDTWRKVGEALEEPDVAVTQAARPSASEPQVSQSSATDAQVSEDAPDAPSRAFSLAWMSRLQPGPQVLKLLLYALAILCAFVGSVTSRGAEGIPHANYYSLDFAAPWLIAGFLLWLLAEVAGNWRELRSGWRGLDRNGRLLWLARALPVLCWIVGLATIWASMRLAPAPGSVGMALRGLLLIGVGGMLWLTIGFIYRRARRDQPALARQDTQFSERQPLRRRLWREISHLRKSLYIAAVISSAALWVESGGIRISHAGVGLWIGQVVLWCLALAPLRWNFFDWLTGKIDGYRRARADKYKWALLVFALLLLLGIGFRYGRLDEFPYHIEGDLVNKLRDATELHQSEDLPVYLDIRSGREPLYMYMLAWFGSLDGMDHNYFSAKLFSAHWSLLTLPLMLWLGVEAIGWRKGKKNLALAVGLIAMGFVAGSFWHVAMGRIGYRAVISALWTALMLIYFARALRHNQRGDFVLAGLFLALNLVSYQSARIMPPGLVAGVLLALLLRKLSWRARATYLLNLASLTLVALAVFLPVLRYLQETPDKFWYRSNRSVFGHEEPAYDGFFALAEDPRRPLSAQLAQSAAAIPLQLRRRGDGRASPALGRPVRRDIHAAGHGGLARLDCEKARPLHLDSAAAALAHPRAIRARAGFPKRGAAQRTRLCRHCPQLSHRRFAPGAVLPAALPLFAAAAWLAVGFAFAAAVILASYADNVESYFGPYMAVSQRGEPQLEAGVALRGYLDSGGTPSNAYFVVFPHWLDTRAAGNYAGVTFSTNDALIDEIPKALRESLSRHDERRIDPDRDLFFLYALQDPAASQKLREWFPQGSGSFIDPIHAGDGVFVYRVPAMGAERLQAFVEEYAS